MRDRLIEIFKRHGISVKTDSGLDVTEDTIDILLANGVIVQTPKFKIEPIKCTKGSGIKGHETYLCYESGIEMASKINEVIAYINNNEQALKGGACENE